MLLSKNDASCMQQTREEKESQKAPTNPRLSGCADERDWMTKIQHRKCVALHAATATSGLLSHLRKMLFRKTQKRLAARRQV